MPSLQYDKHSSHCVLGSVSNSSNSSTLPIRKFVSLCHNRMCQSGYSEKSMSTWFNIERSWFSSRQTTGFSVLSCFVSSSTLKFVLSREKHVRGACLMANNGFLRSIMFHSFFTKRTWFDFLRTGCSSLRANNGFHRSIMIWVWIWLAGLGTFGLLSNFSLWLSNNFKTQFCHPVMLQGDLWRKTRWHKNLFVYDFSSFHPNNFRDTISWECIVKNDGVRSYLIELQSFLQSKVDVDPIHRVLMFLPLFLMVPCKTRCFQVNFVRISVFFVHRIHRREEYRLSFAENLSSRYQSWIDDGM